jgi:hypothetical protein
VPRLPASPANVAIFVAESGLPPEILHAELEAIDREHEALDYSPPGKAGVVVKTFNEVHPVAPPRSWKPEHHPRFLSLPHDLQLYIVAREEQRDKAVRSAQNEAAECRQQLRQIEKTNATKTAA